MREKGGVGDERYGWKWNGVDEVEWLVGIKEEKGKSRQEKSRGRTMMEKRVIPFSPPDISELEINEVAEALRSGWITTGPRVKSLEKRLAEYCHTSKVVCLNSATAAEELNFRICGIGEGDEVITV